jgi:hypothetical protein
LITSTNYCMNTFRCHIYIILNSIIRIFYLARSNTHCFLLINWLLLVMARKKERNDWFIETRFSILRSIQCNKKNCTCTTVFFSSRSTRQKNTLMKKRKTKLTVSRAPSLFSFLFFTCRARKNSLIVIERGETMQKYGCTSCTQ